MKTEVIVDFCTRFFVSSVLAEKRRQEPEYVYFCPKCEKGIRYGQGDCKNCSSILTWIDSIDKNENDI